MRKLDKKKLIKKFDKQADKYEKYLQKQQGKMFRSKMFSKASGKTLEVAIGAGLNMPYYPKSIELIGVDFSPEMLKKARKAAEQYGIRTELQLADVEELDFEENTFDTIVSSGTLCTYEDPLRMLNQFQRWCKPDGQILMIEHGISQFRSITWLQHRLNGLAKRAIGCNMNRDIQRLLKESDLSIEKIDRIMLGSLYLIHAKPS